MANTLSNANIKTFENIVRFLAQQKGTKLMPFCQKRSGKLGESHNWSRVGTIEATTKTGRNVDTPIQDTPFSTRIATPTVKHAGDLVEPEDINKMLIDPKSTISRTIAMAMGRAYDDQIIVAATGNAPDAQGNANALPAGQNVTGGAPGGAGTAGSITLSTIGVVNSTFLSHDIDSDIAKVAVIGPAQVQQLIQIDKATSEFYVTAKALEQHGFVTNWMGYNWICSNRLTQTNTAAGATAATECLFFSDQAMGYMSDMEITTEIEKRADKSFAWQIYAMFNGGAVRVEDEHVVRCDFANAYI